jgi:lipopolysaccharide export system permease protein
MGLSLPHIIALTLPMAVLVAVLYAYSQITADNEVTALKAGGINLVRMMVPLLVAATLLSAVMVWFNDRVLPDSNHRLAELMMDINSKSPTLTMKDRGEINDIPSHDYSQHFLLRAMEIDAATNRMKGIVIYDVSDPNLSTTVYADSGHMRFNLQRTDLFLTLYDGRMDQMKRQSPEDLDRVFFQEQRMQVRGIGNEFQQSNDNYRSDREMSLDTLEARIAAARKDLEIVKAGVVQSQDPLLKGTSAQFPVDAFEMERRAETLQDSINGFLVEWHKKFAIPAACVIFVLIGAPIAVRFPRGGAGMVIAISLLIFAVYYMSLIGGESLGNKGTIPPFLGPWAPNFFFGAIGLVAVLRMGRETSSARGGDWDDMRRTILSLFRRNRS